jgi:DNA polymerase-3 subunit epsilon
MTTFLPHEPLVFVDLETSGANFANDRIIEIGVVIVDQDGAREWSSLVNPETPVSAFITGLTGITTAMVASAPTFAQLAGTILEQLRGRLFIAHNARFDYGFLKREFARLGMDFRAPCLCTVKLSRKLFPVHHRHSLDALVSRYAIQVNDRHRALADARVLWELWQRWHAALPAETIVDTVNAIVGRPQLPAQLDASLLDDLPEAPGAYAMRGQEGELLLVKRSGNIRQHVLAHFSAANRDTALVRNTWHIDWRETAGEFGARLAEQELAQARKKPLDGLCSWQLVQHAEGDFRPQLVFAEALDFATASDLFGLYMNPREAGNALRKIVEAHHLCFTLCGLGTAPAATACIGFKQKTCRGACVGKEPLSLHGARLMAALAKLKLNPWPYPGPLALVERDEFGMREDFHLFDRWRYLGSAHNENALQDLLEARQDREIEFDPETYRLVSRFLKTGKLRLCPLPAVPAKRQLLGQIEHD